MTDHYDRLAKSLEWHATLDSNPVRAGLLRDAADALTERSEADDDVEALIAEVYQ